MRMTVMENSLLRGDNKREETLCSAAVTDSSIIDGM